MDNDYSTRTPIVVCALKNNADPFRSKEEVVLGTEYSYLSVIDAPLYLTNNTRLDITFVVNCLTRQRDSYNASLKPHQEYLTIISCHQRSWIIISKEPRI
jgi:hypothetical protein